jgi:hypothetical protein
MSSSRPSARVALAPGRQIGVYMDHTGCRQSNVFCLQNNAVKSANPTQHVPPEETRLGPREEAHQHGDALVNVRQRQVRDVRVVSVQVQVLRVRRAVRDEVEVRQHHPFRVPRGVAVQVDPFVKANSFETRFPASQAQGLETRRFQATGQLNSPCTQPPPWCRWCSISWRARPPGAAPAPRGASSRSPPASRSSPSGTRASRRWASAARAGPRGRTPPAA